jgi:hypothetical protein
VGEHEQEDLALGADGALGRVGRGQRRAEPERRRVEQPLLRLLVALDAAGVTRLVLVTTPARITITAATRPTWRKSPRIANRIVA